MYCLRLAPSGVDGAKAKKPQFGDKVQRYTSHAIYNTWGITHSGLILITLLRGGDYDKVVHCKSHSNNVADETAV